MIIGVLLRIFSSVLASLISTRGSSGPDNRKACELRAQHHRTRAMLITKQKHSNCIYKLTSRIFVQ